MTLYTKKGDKGTSRIFNTTSGKRIPKDDLVFEALGAVDELNTFLGVCRTEVSNHPYYYEFAGNDILKKMQNYLFSLQAQIASADVFLSLDSISEIEKQIELIEKLIPPVNDFVVAGEGSKSAALLDYSRTICRRAERAVIKYLKTSRTDSNNAEGIIISFLNRLSSLLFALARFENFSAGIKEIGPCYNNYNKKID